MIGSGFMGSGIILQVATAAGMEIVPAAVGGAAGIDVTIEVAERWIFRCAASCGDRKRQACRVDEFRAGRQGRPDPEAEGGSRGRYISNADGD
jgi:hypothetical protein